jgi:lambda family phage portal protein
VSNVFNSPLFQAQQAEAAAARAKPRTVRQRTTSLGQRMYASAQSSRLTGGFAPSNTSADNELISSITMLRARSRSLCRDSSYAKRARVLVVNNVVGTGIGMQAQVMNSRDALNDRVNDGIEKAWCEWSSAENCHTGGRLSFKHFERALMAQVFEAGEVFIRKHPRSFGSMELPFALELIEAERLADNFQFLPYAAQTGNFLRMGVEVDEFFRPVAYYFRKRHPGEIRLDGFQQEKIERVPADQIIHLAVVDRWPQTRGEPWLHTAALTLNHMDGYTDAEIIRARSQAVRMGIIETPEDARSLADDEEDDGTLEIELSAGTVEKLNPGEKWIDSQPTAPNPNMSEFMRYMLREVAAGIGVSYESVSKDYSQSNYSSSRLALLDDRDLWRFYQSWFICDFRQQIHKAWLAAAVFAGKIPEVPVEQYALDQRKFEAVLFKPRGWAWIDPTKEVTAYSMAVTNGFTTVTDVISQTGGGMDIEDVLRVRKRELDMMKDAGLIFETSPEIYMADANKARAEAHAAANPPDPPPEPGTKETENAPPKAGRSFLGVVK